MEKETPQTQTDDGQLTSTLSLTEALSEAIKAYLEKKPHLSVNALSLHSGVSEPTLRRLLGNKVKSIPYTTTILDILSYISGSQSVDAIKQQYPGPIANFLEERIPSSQGVDDEYSALLNEEMQNPLKYLIFKLASNRSGITRAKIIDLYGQKGLQLAEDLLEAGLIQSPREDHFSTSGKSFRLTNTLFIRNFKLLAEYIKPSKLGNDRELKPFFTNVSNSVNPRAYRQIVRIQRSALQKIQEVLRDEKSNGSIPFFMISAIDTQDYKAAHEYED
jgi:hypothetical protein